MSPRYFKAFCCSTCSPATASFSTASGSSPHHDRWQERCEVELLEAIILSVLPQSTPLLIAATGELVTERSGVLNLGVEGMMIVGAACGFGGAWLSGSILVGALCGIIAGTLMSLVFALLALGLAVNQVATGLALTILGLGLSGLLGAGFGGERIPPAPHLYIPVVTDIPLFGRVLFGEDAFVYLSV